jgi:hypothetical protein
MDTLRIDIPVCDLNEQKIIDAKEYYLLLTDEYFRWVLKFKSSEPQMNEDGVRDRQLPWHDVNNDFDFVCKRSSLVGVERLWYQEIKRWKIVLYISGVKDLVLYFKNQASCEPVFTSLVNYVFP